MLRSILASAVILSSSLAAQGVDLPPASSAMWESMAVAHEVSTPQMGFLATGKFLDEMGAHYKIDPACIANHMDRVGLPGPSNYFYVDSDPYSGSPLLHNTLYVFDAVKFGPVYGRFTIKLGAGFPELGLWAATYQQDQKGNDIPTLLDISLRGASFISSLVFDTEDPLASMKAEYGTRRGPQGIATLVPGK